MRWKIEGEMRDGGDEASVLAASRLCFAASIRNARSVTGKRKCAQKRIPLAVLYFTVLEVGRRYDRCNCLYRRRY